jgi:hypothetical protein
MILGHFEQSWMLNSFGKTVVMRDLGVAIRAANFVAFLASVEDL